MKNENNPIIIPNERIIKKILLLRNERVILDVHLAEMYEVETRVLKQAVRRNIERFPADFMFQLDEKEINSVVSQNVIPSKSFFGGANPFAFTETGVAMLSSVLKSKKAIQMNIVIIRTFVALRHFSKSYEEIIRKIEEIETRFEGELEEIYEILKFLLSPKNKRNPIGFKKNDT